MAMFNSSNLQPQKMADASKAIPTFKHVGDIHERFEAYINNHPDKTSDVPVELAARLVEQELLSYYTSPEGLQDIQKSVHRDKFPIEVVALLMEDVHLRVQAELQERRRQNG